MENIFTQIHPWISTFFLQQGVPLESVVLLLLFPIIATLVVILRQVIGVKAFGIYTPTIITVTFIEIAKNNFWDLKYAITIYVSVLVSGMLVRYLLKNIRLLYLPKMAILIAIVSMFMLILLTIAGYFKRTGFASTSIFAILIMITLVEKFIAVQVEKGTKNAIILTLETLFIALISYCLLSYQSFIGKRIVAFVLSFPYIILLILPLNIYIGKWNGLRISEYFRFREVLKRMK